MKIFIAGCARSGTTLIKRLMRSFEDCFVPDPESPFTVLDDIADRARNVVVKRTFRCHEVLSELPADVALIYCIRHPFDVLTSAHPESAANRPFHVTAQRWLSEYHGLRALQLRQPSRQIFYLRYEDLVSNADKVQKAIAAHFSLVPKSKFSDSPGDAIHGQSVRKWEMGDSYLNYLYGLNPIFLKAVANFCLEFSYDMPEGISPTGEVRSPAYSVRRLTNAPIISPNMLPNGLGGNINGPSLVRVPEWISRPLGRYYLYFAHHEGDHIRLAYADRLEGPWQVHAGGTLHLADAPMCHGHIASPDVHVDSDAREIRMIFHGPVEGGKAQRSFLAHSRDGVTFATSPTVLADYYLRVVPWKYGWLGMSWGGTLLHSESIGDPFRPIGNRVFDGYPFGASGRTIRHVALHLVGATLEVFYTRIGDAPEQIWRCELDLTLGPLAWRARRHRPVLMPELTWEGAALEISPSRQGVARATENALRDPAIFKENGATYILYTVAGEQGIAIAQLENQKTRADR